MKKSVKVIALALVAVMLCSALVSCGKRLSGEYEATVAGSGLVLAFEGKKVTITTKVLGKEGESKEGTYEIKDDKITLTFTIDEKEESETYDFEQGEDYIKIGTLGKFTKVEKK